MKDIIYRPAPPAKRFLAFIIELLVSVAYIVTVISTFDESYGQDGAALIAIGTLLIINFAIMTRSTTLGKLVLNMKVVHRRSDKDLRFIEMLFRETLGKCIAFTFFSLGFIWIIIDNENRGWHDLIFNTKVVEVVQVYKPKKDEHDDDFYVQG